MESINPSLDTNGVEPDKLKSVSYDQKWEILKPYIRRLYVERELDVDEVAENLRASYSFNAQASQYRYRFKKWGWKKNIPSRKKAKMCDIRQNRAKAGKQTSLEHEGKIVEVKRLRRYLKETTRRDVAQKDIGDRGNGWKLITGTSFQPGSSITNLENHAQSFLNWNLPYGIMRSPNTTSNVTSPAAISTPSDVVVATPSSNEIHSPRNAPSPLTRLHNSREAIHRAQMFIEGRYHELLRSMTREDKITMSKWLYQYWLYSFKTAKHWGSGPRSWDANKLGFVGNASRSSIPLADSPKDFVEGSQVAENSTRSIRRMPKPSPLCHWSIHYHCEITCNLPKSRTPTPDPDPDMYDEKSWRPWPESWREPPYQNRLLRDLSTNDFSSINAESLPIDVSQVVKVAEKSEKELYVEAIGFSIMARNAELTSDGFARLVNKVECTPVELDAMNLLHLAATYLDGAKTCCTVFEALGGHEVSLRTSTRNNLGHTIFDTLMITVLKSHSLAPPSTVDDNLRDEARFPGEEIDICGRWDADSDTYRSLVASGDLQVPAAWKHKFCHTSVQAVCHSIRWLEFYSREIQDTFIINSSTGLFVKHCMACGLKMEICPLHTVVLITVTLAAYGKEDEDLFGMVAVLLELLALGINPLESKEISIPALFPEAPELMTLSGCQHQLLGPRELASSVPQSIIDKWSDAKRTGWQLFKQILSMSEVEWSDEEAEMPVVCMCMDLRIGHASYFGLNNKLPLLYAMTKAELLTYRRLKESDPWVSHNFDMQAIVDCLSVGYNLREAIGLTGDDLIEEFCERCGRFMRERHRFCNAKDVMKSHFSNLEDWSRTTFLPDIGLY
ncbi:MAG: hypothetical protein Q9167_006347 [Letrouitia subvulpina]